MHSGQWVFFDLDGTLADSLPVMYEVYRNFLKSSGVEGGREEFSRLNGPSIREIVSCLKERYELENSTEDLVRVYMSMVAEAYANSIEPFADATEVLQTLKDMGCELLLTTSSQRSLVDDFVSRNSWQKYFTGYVCGDEVRRAKPDAEIYSRAIDRAGIAPGAAVIVEDSINGIVAGKSAGGYVVGISRSESREQLQSAGSDRTISELGELIPIVEERR